MLRQKKSDQRSKPSHKGQEVSASSGNGSGRRKTSRRTADDANRYRPLDTTDDMARTRGASGTSESEQRRSHKSSSRHSGRTGRVPDNDSLKRQICPTIRSASSDEDIDPELREGIHNIMKLRDEYDKLEGALRKLGVDPETIVGNDVSIEEEDDDEDEVGLYNEDDLDEFDALDEGRAEVQPLNSTIVVSSSSPLLPNVDPDLCTPFTVVAVPANTNTTPTTTSCDESLHARTGGRLRHLDILEEVDESVLSSDTGEDPPLPPPPAPPPPSYPWIQMALPGGGIVSVPLETTSSGGGSVGGAGAPGGGSSGGGGGGSSKDCGSRGLASPDSQHQLIQPLQPTAVTSATGSSALVQGQGQSQQADLLTVAAGEPVTHFNLDQLLEIVQSFQLDTTMAGHDEAAATLQAAHDLALGREVPLGAGAKEIPGRELGCDGKLCDSAAIAASSSGAAEAASSSSAAILLGAATSSSSRGGASMTHKHHRGHQGSSRFTPGTSLTGCEVAEDTIEEEEDDEDDNNSSATALQQQRETHSCPSSPTETDCSSGFSTLRRRSVTVTEKIRTSKDGSKTQVVRQYGCNTSSANEPEQSVTYEKNSYVYINSGAPGNSDTVSNPDHVGSSLLPITASTSSDVVSHGSHSASYTLPRGSATTLSASNAASCGGGPQPSPYRGHIVRLNSLEPNTVMFSTKDYPILADITVPEIIDELEKQFDDKLCDLQGVRLVASNVYICLSRKDSLNYLSTYGFYVRGVPVKVVDITHDSVVVCLTGVPHYITDSTITMLVSTFGIAIGEVERRFYKGVDTGERYVRLKPRAHTQVPDFVTVGGCKILIRVLNNEDVCAPFTLASTEQEGTVPNVSDHQSYNSQTTASFANSAISNYRAKPGHCNGTVNSPSSHDMPSSMPQLTTFSQAQSQAPRATDLLLCGITTGSPSATEDAEERQALSPKIAKSFRSRISASLRPSPKDQGQDEVDLSAAGGGSYVAADPINDIPSLSPPPYKAPGSTGGSSSASNGERTRSTLGFLGRITGSNKTNHEDNENKSGSKRSNGLTTSSANNNNTTKERKYGGSRNTKTDSSNSLGSQGGKACNGNTSAANNKRTSVVFEEPRNLTTTTTTSHSSSSTMPPPPSASRTATATSRTVNGILRKGSVPGDDIVNPPNATQLTTATTTSLASSAKATEATSSKAEPDPPRKSRKNKDKDKHSGKTGKSGKSSSKLESVTESGMEDGDSSAKDGGRSSRSRSSSKTSSSKADKAAKDLALTRDLPWCGCWGNGCL